MTGGSERGRGGQSQGAQGGLGGDVVHKWKWRQTPSWVEQRAGAALGSKGPRVSCEEARDLPLLLHDPFPGLEDEKSRKGRGNAFPLPSPRAFQGQGGEESWSLDVAGYWRRRPLGANPLPQLLDTSSPALSSSPKAFAALLLLLQVAFVFLGIPG